jgi:hypothetical protein
VQSTQKTPVSNVWLTICWSGMDCTLWGDMGHLEVGDQEWAHERVWACVR